MRAHACAGVEGRVLEVMTQQTVEVRQRSINIPCCRWNYFLGGVGIYMGTIIMEGAAMSLESKVCITEPLKKCPSRTKCPQAFAVHGLAVVSCSETCAEPSSDHCAGAAPVVR